MNDEQFERRMEFIVEQQAQFAVDIQQLKEAQAELTKKHNVLTDALTTVVGMVGKLAEAQQRTDDQQKRTDEQLSELTARQADTDDRLNVLIDVVERYFTGNGRPSRSKRRASKSKTRQNSRGKRGKK